MCAFGRRGNLLTTQLLQRQCSFGVRYLLVKRDQWHVAMKNLIHNTPQIRPLWPNVFSKMLQIVAVSHFIAGLAVGARILNAEKRKYLKVHELECHWASTLSCPLRTWRWRVRPSWRILICLKVITVECTFVTTLDSWITCDIQMESHQHDLLFAQLLANRVQTSQRRATSSIKTVPTHTTENIKCYS